MTMWRRREHGFAYLLALILLVVMAALAVAYATSSGISLQQSNNHAGIQRSLLQSESGLAFMTYIMRGVTVPGQVRGQDMLNALAAALQARLNGSVNLHGAQVTVNASTISIPSIATDEGSFGATITLAGDRVVRVTTHGSDGSTSRAVGLNFDASASRSDVFDYGIASKSAVQLTGNASVRGANDPSEANILSATYNTLESFRLTGNCTLAGDIFSSNPDSYVTTTGNVKIGGVPASDPNVNQHIHIGVGETEFPEVDPTVFEPFATNIVDSSTSTVGNKTFTNIRIRANTNPNFTGNITIKGLVFVEVPNRVTFTGNLNMTGMIVTQDAGDNVYTTNTIRFTGNSTFRGVEQLPDTSEFQSLRQMPGSFLLAPGFGLSFTGNFGAVNGCMAADAFTWTGNASGVVHGPIINYSDSVFSLTGNSNVTINRATYSDTPPGFSSPGRFTPVASSYREY
jgi:Tfp pilus assembly protein PilX